MTQSKLLSRNVRRLQRIQRWAPVPKRFWHSDDENNEPPRHRGFVTHYDDKLKYGFAVRHDQPLIEYSFGDNDLHCESVSRVRPLEEVEFHCTAKTSDHTYAKNITGPNGIPLNFHHNNLKIPRQQRKLKLLDISDSEKT
eukprot:UN15332